MSWSPIWRAEAARARCGVCVSARVCSECAWDVEGQGTRSATLAVRVRVRVSATHRESVLVASSARSVAAAASAVGQLPSLWVR